MHKDGPSQAADDGQSLLGSEAYRAARAALSEKSVAAAYINPRAWDAALRTDRLLGDKPAAVSVAPQPTAEPAQPNPQTATPPPGLAEEDPWQF